jgi:hypothetical protein
VIAIGSVAVTELTDCVPELTVIVGEPLSLMITASLGPGTVPVLQLLPTFQLPLVGEIQSTVDNNCRGSSTSTVGWLRFRLPR